MFWDLCRVVQGVGTSCLPISVSISTRRGSARAREMRASSRLVNTALRVEGVVERYHLRGPLDRRDQAECSRLPVRDPLSSRQIPSACCAGRSEIENRTDSLPASCTCGCQGGTTNMSFGPHSKT